MSRKHKNSPSIPQPAPATTGTMEEITEDGEIIAVSVDETPEPPALEVMDNMIQFPAVDPETLRGHVPQDITIRLSRSEGEALKAILFALMERGEKLKPRPGRGTGKDIKKAADAVHWIFQQFAEAIKKEEDAA